MGAGYLDHLIVERKYAEAASLCPKLLRGSASAWERFEQICISHLLNVWFLVVMYLSNIVVLCSGGFSILLNYASFLFLSHICLRITQGLRILCMRFVYKQLSIDSTFFVFLLLWNC